MNRIILAPDSFKGTLTSEEVSSILAEAIRTKKPEAEIVSLPVADGGEGTIDAFFAALSNAGKAPERIRRQVIGPLGGLVSAEYLIFREKTPSYRDRSERLTAVIEMAQTAGLPLARSLGRTDPAITTTYGTGQLILDALARGCTKIIVGLGGSATTDGGCGVADALGVRFFTSDGERFTPVGDDLSEIARIDMTGRNPRLAGAEIVCMCDVDNPLTGERGAAAVFGPQKGADPAMVRMLDDGLVHLAAVVSKTKGLKKGREDLPGAGAAGGLGYGMTVFLGAKLKSGIDTVLDLTGFDAFLKGADYVITGEGKFDSQSVHGKVVSGIGKRAKKKNVSVIVVCGIEGGDVTEEERRENNIAAVYATCQRPRPFEEIRRTAKDDLRRTAERIAETL
jgi:glycerate kinase